MDNLFQEICNFLPPQLTASSKTVEHAVMYKVRLKRVIMKVLKLLALPGENLVHLLFPFFLLYSLTYVYDVVLSNAN